MVININVENDKEIENLDVGLFDYVEESSSPIKIFYVVDSPAEYDEELIAEYPNGGKEYRSILVKPAEGHYEVIYADDNSPIPFKKYPEPDNLPKTGQTFYDELVVRRWRRFTEDEIKYNEEQDKIEREKTEARQDFIDTGADRLDTVEETQDDIVLLLADIVGGAV